MKKPRKPYDPDWLERDEFPYWYFLGAHIRVFMMVNN